MRAYERLLKYVSIHTSSKEGEKTTPSTERQKDLSRILADEMIAIGLQEVYVDENAYTYGVLPAAEGMEDKPCIGLIAHLDTIPDEDFPGFGVKPQLVANYDGGALALGESGRVLSPDQFPDLKTLCGHTLITTDGTTVLGADDKAGIAEILTACEILKKEKLSHGRVALCFPPDEEIGHGAALMQLERLGAAFAFTVDGGDPAEVNFETFNAAAADVVLHGVNVHPGEAKGKMRNAAHLAMEFDALLPAAERPERTEDHEGFFHLTSMKGDVEKAELHYILRDHDAAHFNVRKTMLAQAAKYMCERYGEGAAELTIRDQYRNMEEVLCRHRDIIARTDEAIRKAGLEPKHVPIRGGTDGAQLSFRGLPCPNLGTGGAGFHGPFEHISAENMDKVVEILIHLLTA